MGTCRSLFTLQGWVGVRETHLLQEAHYKGSQTKAEKVQVARAMCGPDLPYISVWVQKSQDEKLPQAKKPLPERDEYRYRPFPICIHSFWLGSSGQPF